MVEKMYNLMSKYRFLSWLVIMVVGILGGMFFLPLYVVELVLIIIGIVTFCKYEERFESEV